MEEKRLISTVKYTAASRPAFFLSEVLPCLDDTLTVPDSSGFFHPGFPLLVSWQKK